MCGKQLLTLKSNPALAELQSSDKEATTTAENGTHLSDLGQLDRQDFIQFWFCVPSHSDFQVGFRLTGREGDCPGTFRQVQAIILVLEGLPVDRVRSNGATETYHLPRSDIPHNWDEGCDGREVGFGWGG